MNKCNDWKRLLEIANVDLALYGLALDVNDNDEEGFFSCYILKDGKVVYTYAQNYYENELDELIDDAWHFVKVNKW